MRCRKLNDGDFYGKSTRLIGVAGNADDAGDDVVGTDGGGVQGVLGE